MLFSQIEFIVFLAVIGSFLLAVRHHRARKLFLLAASYYFYAWWDWRFLSLILTSTIVDYFVGRGLRRTTHPGRRKTLLVISLACNLTLLGFFKYFNFFVGSLQTLLAPTGIHLGTLSIILPVGISFYTFQTLSYTIDVYRNKIEPTDDFPDFALFVAFFPQLVAGPIIRASVFLPQLGTPRRLTWTRGLEGFRQFSMGLFKKVFIADRIAVFVDGVFENAGLFDGPTTWLAVLCYAVQIYCDFSGYSDMAIGTARALGYDFPPNFNYPYVARSVTDFWRRWHISLSTWLRDYLYIPLGGNRKGPRRTYLNLMITMLLGGLWHGAAWPFVFWGGLHGGALAVNKWLDSRRPRLHVDEPSRRWTGFAGWGVTMLIVMVAWVFFRSAHSGFGQALVLLDRMFVHMGGVAWYHPFSIFALVLVGLGHVLQITRLAYLRDLPVTRGYTPVVCFLLVWLVLIFANSGFTPFIYFQF